jgi:hypothetical protein
MVVVKSNNQNLLYIQLREENAKVKHLRLLQFMSRYLQYTMDHSLFFSEPRYEVCSLKTGRVHFGFKKCVPPKY